MKRKFLTIFSGALIAAGLALTIVGGVVSSNFNSGNKYGYPRMKLNKEVTVSPFYDCKYYIRLKEVENYCLTISNSNILVTIFDDSENIVFLGIGALSSYTDFTTKTTNDYYVYIENNSNSYGSIKIYRL